MIDSRDSCLNPRCPKWLGVGCALTGTLPVLDSCSAVLSLAYHRRALMT